MELINYDESPELDGPDAWSFSVFKKYFADCYHKTHRVGGALPWTLKESTLLSRMMGEFKKDDLAELMLWWHTHNSPELSCHFSAFYTQRVESYHQMKKLTGEYEWE
jgi:hypothetical protein